MVRRMGLRAIVALIALGCAGIPAANAQSIFSTEYGGDFAAWADARRVRALDAINRADLSKDEIASILPLLRDLEESEQMRRNDIARLENELQFAEPGDVSVESRISEINAAHRDREARIWNTITERIGSTKAMMLRQLVDDSAVSVDQSAYYRSDHIARIDQMLTEWDTMIAQRVAAHEAYNKMVAEQTAAAEAHNQRVAREEAEAKILREQALAARTAPAPAVTVTEAQTTVETQPAPAVTRTEQPAAEVREQPARFHRATPKPKRAKRVRGLG